MRIWMALAVVLGWAGWIRAQPSSSPPSSPAAEVTDEEFHLALDAQTESEVRAHIAALGSPIFTDREEATKKLLDIGAQAFSLLRQAYHDTDDLEVRVRIESIVYEAFLNHHVFRRMGYLGIRPSRLMTHADDPRIRQGGVGIPLQQVNPGTGAERAGLLPHDVIVAFNGKPLEGNPADGFRKFAAKIQEQGPGARITLTVLRQKERLDIPVVLSQPPRHSKVRVQNLDAKLALANRHFGTWWDRYFRSADDTTEPEGSGESQEPVPAEGGKP